ncbi:hypothetical protein [Mongoliimonas terrestris]|uniref:hypothetical protein n=1 Tax=Mongoliimonas terrestris TaxID=1709001 RepID=UPI0009496A69|nr:hypothetical protein [Mongoliimonas terrestris]
MPVSVDTVPVLVVVLIAGFGLILLAAPILLANWRHAPEVAWLVLLMAALCAVVGSLTAPAWRDIILVVGWGFCALIASVSHVAGPLRLIAAARTRVPVDDTRRDPLP